MLTWNALTAGHNGRRFIGPRRSGLGDAAGFGLVEVMVTIAILAILAAIAAPSYNDYIRNLSLRSVGESLQAAIQQVRGEAIRSNNTAVLQIVDTLDNGCTADRDGRFWVISHCAAEGACGNAIDKSAVIPADGCDGAPIILAKGELGGRNVAIDLANPVVCYSGLGRINPAAGNCPADSLAPGAANVTINITHTEEDCIQSGGRARCLRLTVGMNGAPRLCDPSISASGDPRKC